mmetsp:Transcript_35918/g.69406  ORF Transcript_35918/g.69406 Transcript_35918/m.69406 type:complete len:684 (-) Transcript_35918:126-2177(-)
MSSHSGRQVVVTVASEALQKSLRLFLFLFAPRDMAYLVVRHTAALALVFGAFRGWQLVSRRVKNIVRLLGGWESYADYMRTEHARLNAKSYCEWLKHSHDLDSLDGLDVWRERVGSDYSSKRFKKIIKTLQWHLATVKKGTQDHFGLMWFLRKKVTRSLPGPSNFYRVLHTGGSKRIVQDCLKLAEEALRVLCTTERKNTNSEKEGGTPEKGKEGTLAIQGGEGEGGVSLADKLTYFKHLRHSFGRTALCLSGGATLGLYHVGVCKALFETGILPRVISGASVGSIVTAIVCTRSRSEISDLFSDVGDQKIDLGFFKRDTLQDKIKRLLKEGALLDLKALERCIRANVPDWTFEEAHDRTGMVPNIVVTSRAGKEQSVICNFLSTPNVLIWSAALCSCALPGMYTPAVLYAKNKKGETVRYDEEDEKWIDGSLHSDIPSEHLAQLFNVRFRIVSQVNPHVVSFVEGRRPWWPTRFLLGTIEYLARELRAILVGLNDAGVIPIHKYLIQLLEQGYYGDVTIRPKVSVAEFGSLFRNPTRAKFKRCVMEGERMTYKYIGEILAHSNLERVLDECVQHLLLELPRLRRGGTLPDTLSPVADAKALGMKGRRMSWSVEEFLSNREEQKKTFKPGLLAGPSVESASAPPGGMRQSRSLADIRLLRTRSGSALVLAGDEDEEDDECSSP